MKKNRKNYNVLFVAGALLLLGFIGCKKYDNPPPVYEDLVRTISLQRKVLIISIDGLTGSELQTVAPANISALQKSSKYSYNVPNSAVTTDAASWASILTGVDYNKHLISQNTFDKDLTATDGDFEGRVTSYRNVFDYITQFKNVKTALVTPWDPLRNYMKNADFSPVISTDLAVKDSTVNILNTQNLLGAMIVNFRDVAAAGANGGYLSTNNNYKDAIVKVDAYVGNILTALKARKNYANEDWQVIITTNHGGGSVDPKNGFLIAWHPSLKEKELKKIGFNTPRFNKTTINAVINNDNGLYNPGSNKDFTVQLQVKINDNSSWVGILSKSTNLLSNLNTGWIIILNNGGNWEVDFGGQAYGGLYRNVVSNTKINNKVWHTLTFTVKTEGTKRIAWIYTDGVDPVSRDITASINLSTTEPLKLGYKNKDNNATRLDFYAADMQYFNVALDEATIKANLDLKDITKHPYYDNLIGYWPIDDGGGSLIMNTAPGGVNFSMNGGALWTALGNDIPVSRTPQEVVDEISIIPTTTDIAALALYWLKIPINADWGLDGNPWISKFEIEFLK